MVSRRSRALKVAESWLDGYGASSHTLRKYEAQYQQLCEWMILRDLDLLSLEASHIDEYLKALAEGRLHLVDGKPPKPRSRKTVALACSVLRSLFRALIQAGLRESNPMGQVILPPPESKETPAATTSESPGDWIHRRKQLAGEAPLREGNQIARLRAIVIAEMAFWVGLRRSEISGAVMADFSASATGWQIAVKRFGRLEVDVVDVPGPAIEAVKAYRLARKLDPTPKPSEGDVPLIARLKSEKSVDAWTVANSLAELTEGEEKSTAAGGKATIVGLRRELIHRSLLAAVATRDLSEHVRSKYAVHAVERGLPHASVLATLESMGV